MKKALRDANTAGFSNSDPKIFAPPQTPSRGAGRPKFNQLEMAFAYKPSWVRNWGSMHAISSYRG